MQLDDARLFMFADDDTLIRFHGDNWLNTRSLAEIGMAKVTACLEDDLLP